ncbi:MAG: hypothetical protein ACM3YE_18080 [Bacteroidota bacterium]
MVANRKGMDAEDPLKTGMNEGESEKLGSRPILVIFVGSLAAETVGLNLAYPKSLTRNEIVLIEIIS